MSILTYHVQLDLGDSGGRLVEVHAAPEQNYTNTAKVCKIAKFICKPVRGRVGGADVVHYEAGRGLVPAEEGATAENTVVILIRYA